MIDKFRKYIESNALIADEDKVLLSISGGRDSMVMADLFKKTSIPHGIAHINHKTRGNDNVKDENLIRDYCIKNNISFYKIDLPKEFNTASNFQARARDFRYKWLTETAQKYGYSKIATGHHQSDNVESFFINLLRASGIKGLSGIALKRGAIIRPILFASAKEICEYQDKNNVAYLEDSSNSRDKYLRNNIRHNLVPILKNIHPSVNKSINESISHISDAYKVLQELIDEKTRTLITYREGFYIYDLSQLKKLSNPETILLYSLSKYNFNKDSVTNILSSDRSGAQFNSPTHQANLERNNLYIHPIIKEASLNDVNMSISENGDYVLPWGAVITFEVVEHLGLGKSQNVEYLGFEEYPYPLQLRKRKNGDSFKPLGLKGKNQKIKDYITNNKINFIDKSRLLILKSKSQICCIIGHRISENFSINDRTKFYLKIEIKNTNQPVQQNLRKQN